MPSFPTPAVNIHGYLPSQMQYRNFGIVFNSWHVRRETVRRKLTDEILHAASRVFARKGFQSAAMDDIAREARTTKSMIYYHFPSKSALYDTLLERELAPLEDALASAPDARAAAEIFLRHFLAHPASGTLLREFFSGCGELDPAQLDRYLSRIVGPFARHFSADDAEQRAFSVVALLTLPLLRALVLGGEVHPDDILRHVEWYLSGQRDRP